MKSSKPLVLGILNVTPDSFSDGGRFLSLSAALTQARLLSIDGADIIDVGGESTRPGAESVSLQEEQDRVLPVIQAIRKESSVTLSIDTTKYEVAKAAIELGATIINDVSCGQDIRFLSLLEKNIETKIILMHRKGEPKTMQENPCYDLGVVSEVKAMLSAKVAMFTEAGISKSRIWIDPGIGFGKTLNHNLDLLRHLKTLIDVGGNIVIGTSRKTFLAALLKEEKHTADQREAGTLSSHLWAYQAGAGVFRVHDVLAMKRALTTWDAISDGCI